MPPTGWPSAPFPLPVGWNGDNLKVKCWRWRSYAQPGDRMTVWRGAAPWLCVSTCFCYVSNSVTYHCVFQYTFLGCICYSSEYHPNQCSPQHLFPVCKKQQGLERVWPGHRRTRTNSWGTEGLMPLKMTQHPQHWGHSPVTPRLSCRLCSLVVTLAGSGIRLLD